MDLSSKSQAALPAKALVEASRCSVGNHGDLLSDKNQLVNSRRSSRSASTSKNGADTILMPGCFERPYHSPGASFPLTVHSCAPGRGFLLFAAFRSSVCQSGCWLPPIDTNERGLRKNIPARLALDLMTGWAFPGAYLVDR